MQFAGLAAGDVTRICVTHFHGDHSLGLPGVLQRMSLDDVPHPVSVHFPGEHAEYFERLSDATPYFHRAEILPVPGSGLTAYDCGAGVTLSVAPLDHGMPCQGYRIDEPDGVRMLPERLVAAGISGPDIARLQAAGRLGEVTLESVSRPKPGQSFAFLMDTKRCPGAEKLASGVDLLVIESTFLDAETDLAQAYGHLTARQAARIAADAGVRELVLTHFSQRYPPDDAERFRDEAAAEFDGPIHVAADLMRVPFPKRR
jgi:ribonuclease Z